MLRRHNFDYLLGGDFGHLGDKATSFRKILEGSILATDMSRHFGFVNQLVELGKRFECEGPGKGDKLEEDRLLFCAGLIKCGDISNPVCHLPFFLSPKRLIAHFLLPPPRRDLIGYRELGRQHC